MKSLLLSLIGLVIPSAAFAHVKWFVETEEIIAQETVKFSITDPAVIIWIVVLIAIIALGFVLEIKFGKNPASRKRWNKRVLRIFQALVGAWLLLQSYQQTIIAPPFEADTSFGIIVLVLQALSGALMLLGFAAPIASVLLLLVYVGASLEYGWLNLLEHVHLVGIALAYLVITTKASQPLHRFSDWAVTFLRIGAGISLIVLGLREKILHPELGIRFLETHPWNFMQMLGFEQFTDALFVLSAGMVEMLFGIVYLLGIVTKLNTVALVIVFISTALIMGPMELVGHLPIVAIAIVLLVYGHGGKLNAAQFIKRKFF